MSRVMLSAGPVAISLSRAGIRGGCVLVALLLVACLAALAAGEVMMAPSALWEGLTGQGGPAEFVLWQIRLPRVAAGVLAGAAFGLSGALFQSLLRNPLASPDVIGFASGAGFGTVATVAFAGAAGLGVTLGAAAGGLVAAVLAGALAWQRGGIEPLRLILIGIGLGLTFTAGTEFLMTRLPQQQAAEAARWLTGSLAGRGWGHVWQIAICLFVLAVLLAAPARWLRLLELGDDAAAGLGVAVARSRLLLAAIGVGLAASAVAVAGPVPFVALLAAPLARGFGGRPGVWLTGAALMGAILTVVADLAARAAVPGVQLPLGVMTGLIGAPYLLWLLGREMKRGAL